MKPRYYIEITDSPLFLWESVKGATTSRMFYDGTWSVEAHNSVDIAIGYRQINKKEARSLFPNAFPKTEKEL